MMRKLFRLFFVFSLVFVLTSCSSDDGNNGGVLSSEKDILSFSIGETDFDIDDENLIIDGNTPYCLGIDTPVNLVAPLITISDGASISPASGVAQDFTSPVIYTVTAEDGSTKEYEVTLEVEEFEYELGDEGPTGGWIFYIDEACAFYEEWTYLEAAPEDLDTQAWSSVIDEEIGTTEEGIGTGLSNTLAIMEQVGHTTSAANSCQEYFPEGHDITEGEWFLPSKDELDAMYENLHNQTPPLGNFAGSVYWSSSEVDDFTAWTQNFGSGFQYDDDKDFNFNVRCVRAF